ncbi:uncharacterized protein KD926_006291 [Aspergillus affinis]|uniref:uncharacterized protein n=1 Tax=Aspergillus affinis TaxID=1070780 RepID=UPI0022FF0204|nr:uncharacterized protein KD926_006291 [Aspergillus affinis]KAI9041954.1 hypothetical protein KD926_006291 [Aspergillus affinis]
MAILLRCPDVETLRALVHASPAYHAAYRKVRNQALFKALCAEYYGMESVDAVVALRSRGLYADIPSNKGKIYTLLDQWQRHKEIRRLNEPSADEPADLDEIIRLIRLHKIMKFCLVDFCNAVHRPVWINSEQWNNDVLPISLSRTEKTRLLRALYRVQIYANIFGHRVFYPGEKTPIQWRYNSWEEETFETREVWRLFMSPMAPWEFQEYGCVWQYIYERYRQPYQEVADYFDQFEMMPMERVEYKYQIDPLPTNCSLLDTDEVRGNTDIHMSNLATMGPVFFHKFIRDPCFLHRRDMIVVNTRFTPFTFDEVSHDLHFEDMHPLRYPGFKSPDDFRRTKGLWKTLSPIHRPNIACARLWFKKLSEDWLIYSMGYEGEEFWKWGYAIWDDARLIEWKKQLSLPFSTPYTTEPGRRPSEDYLIYERLPS